MIVAPILTLLFFVIGMGGAYFVAVVLQHVDQGQWVANLRDIVQPRDVLQGVIKAVFFGFMVALGRLLPGLPRHRRRSRRRASARPARS